jgi:SET domain-containing protein
MPARYPELAVRRTKARGRGVFAGEDIPAGRLIEVAPVIVFPASEYDALCRTALGRYFFEWGDGEAAMALGFGSIYNHSPDANACYTLRERQMAIAFWAVRDIRRGEEIRTNYHGTPDCADPIDDWL